MKKSDLGDLNLNKKVISNLDASKIYGGFTSTCICGSDGCPPSPTDNTNCCYE